MIIIAPARLRTCRRLKRSAGHEDRFLSDREVLGSVTAVVLLMEIGSKLSAIVTPTHEVSLAALVTVMSTAVKRSVTVSLPQATGLLWSTAPPTVVVPSTASLAWDSLST